MGGATPVYNGKIILEVPVDFPLNTTFLSRCLKVGKDTPSFYRTNLFHPPENEPSYSNTVSLGKTTCKYFKISLNNFVYSPESQSKLKHSNPSVSCRYI